MLVGLAVPVDILIVFPYYEKLKAEMFDPSVWKIVVVASTVLLQVGVVFVFMWVNRRYFPLRAQIILFASYSMALLLQCSSTVLYFTSEMTADCNVHRIFRWTRIFSNASSIPFFAFPIAFLYKVMIREKKNRDVLRAMTERFLEQTVTDDVAAIPTRISNYESKQVISDRIDIISNPTPRGSRSSYIIAITPGTADLDEITIASSVGSDSGVGDIAWYESNESSYYEHAQHHESPITHPKFYRNSR